MKKVNYMNYVKNTAFIIMAIGMFFLAQFAVMLKDAVLHGIY